MFIISSPSVCWASANVRGVESVSASSSVVPLGDHAGAAAVRTIKLDQLDIEERGYRRHRPVELRREAAAHAPGPVRDLHEGVSALAPLTALSSSVPLT